MFKVLAFAVDCNGRWVELSPLEGAKMAVAEVCRNLICAGAEPIGITDCLNFGNPERPEVMEQFALAVDGLAAACTALGVPIVSGNVSLYNETDGRPILPTPTVAAVGLLADEGDRVTQWFKGAGDVVVLLGENDDDALGGSEYLVRKTGRLGAKLPRIDLDAERRLQALVLELARARLLRSAHDVSDGGLAVTLAECCATSPLAEDVGARIDLDAPAGPSFAARLFGEAPSRVVVSVPRGTLGEVLRRAQSKGVRALELGVTGGHTLSIAFPQKHRPATISAFSLPIAEIRRAREACLVPLVGA
jgi:phosphoribosylformylglycinamidine synthase